MKTFATILLWTLHYGIPFLVILLGLAILNFSIYLGIITFKKIEVTNTTVKKINFNSKVLSIILNISFTILAFVIIGAFIIKFNTGLDLLYKSFLTIIMMICLKKYICRNYTINGLQNFIGK